MSSSEERLLNSMKHTPPKVLIPAFVFSLLLSGCTSTEGYRYLGEQAPRDQEVEVRHRLSPGENDDQPVETRREEAP